jgi:hypothetical protein
MRNSVLELNMALGQRDRHDDQFVGIHAQPLADRFEHADDAQAAVADADQLADGRVGAEHFLTDRGADDGDRRAAIPVAFGQALPLGQFKIADGNEVGGAGNHDFAQAAAEADLGIADGERRNPAHRACSRRSAAASSMVRSRGVVVMALAGLKPPVPERPGRTMTRLVPIEENWPTT